MSNLWLWCGLMVCAVIFGCVMDPAGFLPSSPLAKILLYAIVLSLLFLPSRVSRLLKEARAQEKITSSNLADALKVIERYEEDLSKAEEKILVHRIAERNRREAERA